MLNPCGIMWMKPSSIVSSRSSLNTRRTAAMATC